MKKYWPLILIIFLAILLRFFCLTDAPPSLNWDEISHGYNAYSILKTGQDEWGVSWPIIFRAYGDYKLPVYIYLTALSEAIFGLNEFAVRFPSALAGVLSVLFTFLLVERLFSSPHSGRVPPIRRATPGVSLALLASFFLAVSPWHVFLSRPAFEANLASFLVISGVYCFLLGLRKKWFLPLSIFFLGLSVHTYNSARIFVPLILVTLLSLQYFNVLKWVKKKKGELIISVVLALVLFGFLGYSFFSTEGRARFKWVSVIDQGTVNRINNGRASSSLPEPLPKLIHNKATYFAAIFGRNYLSNLSPTYLFLTGGSHYQYNLPDRGIIYPIQAPFLLLGFYWLIRNWSKKESKLILFWWLLAIIPAAVTRDNPHVLRTILVLPMPQVVVAIGAVQVWRWWQKRTGGLVRRLLPMAYLVGLTVCLLSFLSEFSGSYRREYSWSWQYGYQQVADYVHEHYQEYDQILVTKKYGEPHEFLLFYLKWDPEEFRNDPHLNRYFQTDWYWVDSFAKFIFINDWEIKLNGKWKSPQGGIPSEWENGKYLLITSPGNYPEGWSKIETINFLDGQPVFEILERRIG